MKMMSEFQGYFTLFMRSFVALFIAFLLSSGVTFAQDTSGLRIAPSIIEDRINPGETFSGTLRATNLSAETRTYQVFARDIKGINSGGQPRYAEPGEKTGFELSDWISFSVKEVTIGPDEEVTIPFVVSVPLDASPGGHFGGLFLGVSTDRQRETGASVGFEVGTIMNFRISGDIVEEAQIREFTTDKLLYGETKVQLDVTIENEGNVLIRPRGPIDITDMFGNRVGTLRINDDGAAVLPNSRRSYGATWETDGFHFGRYEAILAVLYGEDGRKTISAATAFWVLPLGVLAPVLGGLLVFLLIIYFGVRAYVQKRLREVYQYSRVRPKGARGKRGAPQKAPVPKLAVVAITILVFSMIFLAVLFFLFA